jgi:hypothetical protein
MCEEGRSIEATEDMWKWIQAGVIVVVVAVSAAAYHVSDKLYLRFPHRAISAAEFGKLYAPAELRSDFRFITATIEHIHPDFAAMIDPNPMRRKNRQSSPLSTIP